NIISTKSACLGVWIKLGSRYENLKNNGVSHFIEHMIFKGSKKRSCFEIAKSLESVGGSLNAFTSKEFTCYFAHVLSKDLPLSIDILSDMIMNPLFDKSDIANERNVVIEEIKSVFDTPDELIHEHFQENVFYKHPLGYSILGKTNNIKSFNRKIIKDNWKKNYTSNRIVVSVAGNVKHDNVVKLVEKHLSIPNGDSSIRIKRKIGKGGNKTSVIEKNIKQAHTCLGNIGISYYKREKYALMVLITLLGGGMSSRLFQVVREKHALAYTIYSFAEFLSDSGIFGIYLGTDKEKVSNAIDLVKREFGKVRNKRISSREINRIKSQLTGSLILGLENISSRMTRLAKMELYLGKYCSLEEVLKEIDSVTSDDVLALSNRILGEENLKITILKPY
ncbi:M16 family metallopeptidase, partial [candidate division KSB1 bacterium]